MSRVNWNFNFRPSHPTANYLRTIELACRYSSLAIIHFGLSDFRKIKSFNVRLHKIIQKPRFFRRLQNCKHKSLSITIVVVQKFGADYFYREITSMGIIKTRSIVECYFHSCRTYFLNKKHHTK